MIASVVIGRKQALMGGGGGGCCFRRKTQNVAVPLGDSTALAADLGAIHFFHLLRLGLLLRSRIGTMRLESTILSGRSCYPSYWLGIFRGWPKDREPI